MSSSAPVSRSDPKTSVHSSNGRLAVARTEPLSHLWLNISKIISAPLLDSGAKPSSSMISSLSLDSFF